MESLKKIEIRLVKHYYLTSCLYKNKIKFFFHAKFTSIVSQNSFHFSLTKLEDISIYKLFLLTEL